MIDVTQVRAEYPEPVTTDDIDQGRHPPGRKRDQCYCVGGALMYFLWPRITDHSAFILTRFPTHHNLSCALRAANTKLDFSTSRHYADRIIKANDARDFERAWNYLGYALKHGGPDEES